MKEDAASTKILASTSCCTAGDGRGDVLDNDEEADYHDDAEDSDYDGAAPFSSGMTPPNPNTPGRVLLSTSQSGRRERAKLQAAQATDRTVILSREGSPGAEARKAQAEVTASGEIQSDQGQQRQEPPEGVVQRKNTIATDS
eukprot:GSA25T00005898001.1